METKRKKTPAHLVIREHLLELINALPANARLPTEVALAAQFGVSRLTAHKAMARLQQEGIVVRRGKGGTFVAREAHRIQTNGGRGRNGVLAIAYPNWFSYDYWFKVDVAERLALQHGMAPLTIKITPDTPMEEIAEMVREARAAGLLLMAPGGVVERQAVRALEKLGCPCAMLQPNEHVRAGFGICAVSPDYRAIGRLQVEALAAHGHVRIVYVREEPWSRAGELQLEGMREGAARCGLGASAVVVPADRTGSWGAAAEAAYERTRTLMARAQRPTALVFDALAGAHAGLRALGELGVRTPADVSVLVSATDHPFARYDLPRIGGVWAPSGTLVERAVEAIRNAAPEPRIWVEPVVDLRESVATARK